MLQLIKGQMPNHFFKILFKLPNETRNVQISVCSIGKSKIIGLCEDFNTMREIALTSDTFLECSTCRSSTINFTIIQAQNDKLCRQSVNMWLHDFRRVCPGKTPDNIARRVTDMRSNWVIAFIDIIEESFVQNCHIGIKTLGKKQTTPGML